MTEPPPMPPIEHLLRVGEREIVVNAGARAAEMKPAWRATQAQHLEIEACLK